MGKGFKWHRFYLFYNRELASVGSNYHRALLASLKSVHRVDHEHGQRRGKDIYAGPQHCRHRRGHTWGEQRALVARNRVH